MMIDGKKHLLCRESALRYNGLYSPYPGENFVFATLDKSLDGVYKGNIRYAYSIYAEDFEHYTRPLYKNPNILVPTAERAIVEGLLYRDDIDLGFLSESIYNYQFFNLGETNIPLLHEVAAYYFLPADVLEFWLKDCRDVTFV